MHSMGMEEIMNFMLQICEFEQQIMVYVQSASSFAL